MAEGVIAINHLLSEEISIRNMYNSLNINPQDMFDIAESNKFIGLNSKSVMTHIDALNYYDMVFRRYIFFKLGKPQQKLEASGILRINLSLFGLYPSTVSTTTS